LLRTGLGAIADCGVQADMLDSCASDSQLCDSHFCPSCNMSGHCDATCGFCTTTFTATSTTTTSTTTTLGEEGFDDTGEAEGSTLLHWGENTTVMLVVVVLGGVTCCSCVVACGYCLIYCLQCDCRCCIRNRAQRMASPPLAPGGTETVSEVTPTASPVLTWAAAGGHDDLREAATDDWQVADAVPYSDERNRDEQEGCSWGIGCADGTPIGRGPWLDDFDDAEEQDRRDAAALCAQDNCPVGGDEPPWDCVQRRAEAAARDICIEVEGILPDGHRSPAALAASVASCGRAEGGCIGPWSLGLAGILPTWGGGSVAPPQASPQASPPPLEPSLEAVPAESPPVATESHCGSTDSDHGGRPALPGRGTAAQAAIASTCRPGPGRAAMAARAALAQNAGRRRSRGAQGWSESGCLGRGDCLAEVRL